MRNIVSDIIAAYRQSVYNLAMDWRDAFNRHFSFSYYEKQRALFLKVPFLPLSTCIEWGGPHLGYGAERVNGTNLEFFLGTIRGVLSIEKKYEGNEA